MAALSKIHCVYGLDELVAKWAGTVIGVEFKSIISAVGIAKGTDIIGACVYNNYCETSSGKPLMIEISMASIDKRWCTRAIIKELLLYPFAVLRVERVQLVAAKRNKFVRRFNERLGFKFEGIARKAYFDGSDAALYSMLRHEWSKGPWQV